MTSNAPETANDFGQLLARARREVVSGAAADTSDRDQQQLLNGVPYHAFRQSIDLPERRRQGTFFSSRELASELAELLQSSVRAGGVVLDPTSGMGDLLLGYAERLPLAATLPATLEAWGRQLSGIEKRADLVAMTKARLIALARFRGNFLRPLKESEAFFPQIVVGDMFEEADRIRSAEGILFNPPFGQTADHTISDWGTGRLNAAALCLDALLTSRAPRTAIAAVLPDVLRCGTRYARFRNKLVDSGLGGRFWSRGRFDAWTDVDVFTTLLTPNESDLWSSPTTGGLTIGDRFTVRVGPVVPHRHPHSGNWYGFVCAKSVPPWSTAFVPKCSRRFRGTTFAPPFVVVRRTSSPSDRKRAVGAIIVGDRPVAVENHLIVLTPIDGRVESCAELLSVLSHDATSSHLNREMRCRHLTTGSIREIPWVEID